MTNKDVLALANILLDMAEIRASLDLSVAELKGLQERLAALTEQSASVVQDVSGQIFLGED
jgi:hypothetical protein